MRTASEPQGPGEGTRRARLRINPPAPTKPTAARPPAGVAQHRDRNTSLSPVAPPTRSWRPTRWPDWITALHWARFGHCTSKAPSD
eukprot:2797554-Pyramimonas_sp.AAC.1